MLDSACVHITDVSRVRKGLVLVSKDVSHGVIRDIQSQVRELISPDQLLIYNRTSGIYTET